MPNRDGACQIPVFEILAAVIYSNHEANHFLPDSTFIRFWAQNMRNDGSLMKFIPTTIHYDIWLGDGFNEHFHFYPHAWGRFFMNTLLKWHDLDGSCIASPTPSDLSSFHLHLDPGCCCTGVQDDRANEWSTSFTGCCGNIRTASDAWQWMAISGAGERFRWWFTAWLGG